MKFALKSLLTIVVIVFAATSCSNEESKMTPTPRVDIPMSRAESEIVGANNSFSLKFFKKALETQKDNFCTSPMSLSMALSMTANGASGEALTEILETIGFEANDIHQANTFNSRIVKDLCAVDRTTKISLANSIWIDNGFKVKDGFVSDNRNTYGAEIFNETLSSQATMQKINSWCKDKTSGCIPNFLTKPLDENCVIALLNALYFNGIWVTPFDKSKTEKSNFYNNGETLIQTDMMQTEIKCRAAHDSEGADWISLPYGNGAFHMIIIQPDHIRPGCVTEYFSNISDEDFSEMLSGLQETKMKLKMPKFDFESEINLKDILMELGIKKMFDGTGDFSKIADAGLAFKAMQKSKITVNETGTEAAAVTKIEGGFTSPGPIHLEKGRLTIDRPFAFFIREVSTGAIIFTGHVNKL